MYMYADTELAQTLSVQYYSAEFGVISPEEGNKLKQKCVFVVSSVM